MVKDKDFSVNVISKSGTTTEPAIAFRVFRKLLEEKYGKEGAKTEFMPQQTRQKALLKSFRTTKAMKPLWYPMMLADVSPF